MKKNPLFALKIINAIVISLAISGCAQPETFIPPELDIIIGQPTTQALAALWPPYSSAQWQTYVNNLGKRLSRESNRHDIDFLFHVVTSSYPNAFSSPDGNIFVTTGLLKLCDNNEEEIAAVLAHEISHVENRHGIRLLSRQLGRRALLFAFFGFEQPLAKTASSLATTLQTLGYGRELELEADQSAIKLLKKTNFQPNALGVFLKKIKQVEENQPLALPDFLNTHPPTKDRLEALRANKPG